MPNILDWKPDARRALLVFGGFKTGKTAGACTFPRPNVIDFDGGLATVAQGWWQQKFGKRAIMYETFKESDKTQLGVVKEPHAFDDACKYFDQCMKPAGTWKGAAVGRDMFDTWIIDSGTTLSESTSNKGIYLLGGNRTPGAKSETHGAALKNGLIVLKQQDFGAERSMTEQFVQMLLDTDKHVILICHEKVLYNDSDAIIGIVPLLTGQSAERIPLKFDEVYRMRLQKVGMEMKRTLQTQPDGLVRCGTRMGVPDGTEWNWDALNAALTPKEK